MSKKIGALLFCFALIITTLFSGCAGKPAENNGDDSGVSEGASFPYTFTDSVGNEITLEKKPEKVAVLFSSYADIWLTAGGEVSITVGDSIERGFCDDSVLLVDSGAGMSIDMELLTSYEPDFVIGSADMSAQLETCEKLNSLGIPSAAFQVESLDDYLAMLKICTDITGNNEAYETYGTNVKAETDALLSKVSEYAAGLEEPVSVLFIRAGSGDSATKAKTAENHFVGMMLSELKTVNIADSAGILSDHLSLEHIVTNQPDIILLVPQGDEEAAKSYIEDLFSKSGWRDLDAVASGNYYFLPKDLFHYKPNKNWTESYEYLIDLIYPEFKYD